MFLVSLVGHVSHPIDPSQELEMKQVDHYYSGGCDGAMTWAETQPLNDAAKTFLGNDQKKLVTQGTRQQHLSIPVKSK